MSEANNYAALRKAFEAGQHVDIVIDGKLKPDANITDVQGEEVRIHVNDSLLLTHIQMDGSGGVSAIHCVTRADKE